MLPASVTAVVTPLTEATGLASWAWLLIAAPPPPGGAGLAVAGDIHRKEPDAWLFLLDDEEKIPEMLAANRSGDMSSFPAEWVKQHLSGSTSLMLMPDGKRRWAVFEGQSRSEPIAELFNELDPAIDAREDDFKEQAKDPNFTGFHRIEYALWVEKSTDGVKDIADKLEKDVKALKAEIDTLNFPPSKVVGGAAVLIEEVAGSKISGEEDRYSHTDLSDFQANIEGAQKIVDLFRNVIAEKDKALLDTVDANFKQINEILAKYKKGDGFESYDKLSEDDRKKLQAPINTLAEELGKLRGTLGLN